MRKIFQKILILYMPSLQQVMVTGSENVKKIFAGMEKVSTFASAFPEGAGERYLKD